MTSRARLLLLSIGDCLSIVFEHVSAYDLAFLYFSGDSKLRRRISKLATHFHLSYSPYRRIAWPRNFLPLLPALKYFSIGGSSDGWYPFVPDIDIRMLPTDLISLHLRISNGLFSLVEGDLTKPVDVWSLHIRDLRKSFPHLQHLSWENQANDFEQPQPLAREPALTHLATPNLRSLHISVLCFPFSISKDLPDTLENLSISAMSWKPSANERDTTDSKFRLPKGLNRLTLKNLGLALDMLAWPSSLKHLFLDFNSSWMYHDCMASTLLGERALPSSLESLVMYAPYHSINSAFVGKLPQSLTELRLYLRKVAFETFGPTNTFVARLPMTELRILHLCMALTSMDDSLADSLFFDEMPPNLVEFIVTAGKFPHKHEEMQNMPLRLASRRSSPAIITSPYPPSGTFQSHLKTLGYSLSQLEYPNSLMDLEESIFNFQSFPQTLTRLSILSHAIAPFRRDVDYSSIATYIPNVVDLSLCLDPAFEILRYCSGLPLVALALDVYPGRIRDERNSNGIDIDLAGTFDLRCFRKLERLCIHPRFIGAQYTRKWLKRLPPTLKDLSFVPYRSTWTDASILLQMESWIVFPRLPRSLTRFTGVISDLHIHNIFALLPDSLTELYLLGPVSIYGQFGTSPLQVQANDSAPITSLNSLPLSLHTVCLPSNSLRTIQSKLNLRPQLSNIFLFSDHTRNDPMQPMPPGYSAPPTLSEVKGIDPRQIDFICSSVRLSLVHHQDLAPDSPKYVCMDTAERAPADELTAKQIKLMAKGVKMIRDGKSVEEVQEIIKKKCSEEVIAELSQVEGKKTKKSTCNPS